MNRKIAIIGAGNGGQAMAAYFNMLAGYKVKIYDHFQEAVDALNEKKQIILEGAIQGCGEIEFASTDIGEVVNGADLIIVVNPAIYHNQIAKDIAPYLEDGQIVFLNPSQVFGAFAFKKTLEEAGCNKKITIGESNTLLFAARLVEPCRVNIGGKKDRLLVSAFPACNRDKLYDMIRPVIKELQECDTVLETSFDSTNCMMHPVPTVMNASWAESGAKFRYYCDGIGDTVGAYLEKMDAERIAIGEKLGLKLGKDLFDLFMEYEDEYNTKGKTISEVVKNVDAYQEIYSANTIRTRYIYEDIPTGLVPFVAMGKLLDMPVNKMDFAIDLCEQMLNEDLRDRPESRNLENLGLAGMTAEEIINYAKTGVK